MCPAITGSSAFYGVDNGDCSYNYKVWVKHHRGFQEPVQKSFIAFLRSRGHQSFYELLPLTVPNKEIQELFNKELQKKVIPFTISRYSK